MKNERTKPQDRLAVGWRSGFSGGILHSSIRLGARVSKGSKLGEIADPFGENQVEVLSPASGVIIGRLNLPLVHKGDALFHIACFEKRSHVLDTLESFEEEFQGSGV